MFTFLADIGRLVGVAWVFVRQAAPIQDQFASSAPIRLVIRLLARKNNTDAGGASLTKALLSLGPIYIKLGQLMATRPDIIGMRPAQQLSQLKDSVPPFSTAQAIASLRTEFGADTDSLFGDIGEAVAAASIAQVHRIDTQQGPRAVKILRPDIEKHLDIELRVLSRAAQFLYRTTPSVRTLEPVVFIRTVAAATEKELDLTFEAGAMDEYAIQAEKDGYFHVPKVDWTRSSRRVLTTHWVDGIPLTHKGALDQANRAEIANCISRGFLSSALERGFFHADMHEGNMILRQTEAGEPRLALVDFGLVGRIGPREQRFLARTLHGFLKRDYTQVAQVHFDAGYVPVERSPAEFAQALRAVGESVLHRTTEQMQIGQLIVQIFEVTRRFGIHLRPELVLLQKSMVQVEGVARSIDPHHDPWAAAAPVVNSWVAREFGADGIIRMASRSAGETFQTIARIPALVESLQQRLDDDTRECKQSSSQSGPWRLIALVSVAALVMGVAATLYQTLAR